MRVLITRLSAVGDCIHTIPLVHAAREKYPNAFIAWATQNGPATLLENLDGLDQIIRVNRDWLKSWNSIGRLRRDLQSYRFDVTIDPQSLTKSCLLGWLSGARKRIGFARPQGRELSLLLNNQRVVPRTEHVVDRYLELLEPLNIQRPDVRFDMAKCHRADQKIDAFLKSSGIESEFLVVNPGAGWPSKVWPADRFAGVVREIGIQSGLPTVIAWAGDKELEMAEKIVSESAGFGYLAPDTNLPELRSLVTKTKLFVGSDTGPLHLAAAMGTKCVAIFGPTSPTRCGPYGDSHISLHKPDSSHRKLRSDDNSAMLKTTADEVIAACWKALRKEEAA